MKGSGVMIGEKRAKSGSVVKSVVGRVSIPGMWADFFWRGKIVCCVSV